MKKKLAVFSSIIIIFFAACEFLNYNAFFFSDTTEINIPKASAIKVPISLETDNIKSNGKLEFETNGIDIANVEEILIDAINVSLDNTEEVENLEFINSIKVFIKSADDSIKTQIGYLTDFQTNNNKIDLITIDNNLKKFFLKDFKYKIETELILNKYLTNDVKLKLSLKFKVQ